ncbi:MAG: serine protease [Gammaproteobacteria bacterium]
MSVLRYLFISILGYFPLSPALADDTASQLFDNLKQMVYQIRVIDNASGDKSSIGSGFQVSSDGRIATNFHVVASYVHNPEQYQLEYVFHDGTTGALTLEGFDVIHDLAIVRRDANEGHSFRFRNQLMTKGEQMYSMGNPLDLGMTIIEGNYNGLIETSRYQKVLFSGSLNAGMSGGPAIDDKGQVIGINVSKGNEQLSFLVPVDNLVTLIQRLDEQNFGEDYEAEIQQALLKDQDAFYQPLLKQDWPQDLFVKLLLPGEISPSLKCWGNTTDNQKIRYDKVQQFCQSQDNIYLDSSLETGTFSYEYTWLASDTLNRFQFYHLLETNFVHPSQYTAFREDDVSNYACDTDFIRIQQRSFRISSCSRSYHKYPQLFDTVIMLASIDRNDQGVIMHISAAGISTENATALLAKFLEAIQWKP